MASNDGKAIHTFSPVFLYPKQVSEGRSNTAITKNTMQAIEEARKSKGEEEAEAKEKKKTAF
jgi:hypothetical protein